MNGIRIITFIFIGSLLCCSVAYPSEIDNKVIACIALEAGNQPLIGQIWVACVIRNRAKKRGLSYEEVVTQKSQFSCFTRDSRGNIRQARKRPLSEAELQTAQLAWDQSEDYAHVTADLYFSPSLCFPNWDFKKTKWLGMRGDHIFFEEL